MNPIQSLIEKVERFEYRKALLIAWLGLENTPSYVERFADRREPFEADNTSLPVGEQNDE